MLSCVGKKPRRSGGGRKRRTPTPQQEEDEEQQPCHQLLPSQHAALSSIIETFGLKCSSCKGSNLRHAWGKGTTTLSSAINESFGLPCVSQAFPLRTCLNLSDKSEFPNDFCYSASGQAPWSGSCIYRLRCQHSAKCLFFPRFLDQNANNSLGARC